MPSPLSPTPTFGIAQRFTLSRAPLHLSQFSSSPCCTSCNFFFFFVRCSSSSYSPAPTLTPLWRFDDDSCATFTLFTPSGQFFRLHPRELSLSRPTLILLLGLILCVTGHSRMVSFVMYLPQLYVYTMYYTSCIYVKRISDSPRDISRTDPRLYFRPTPTFVQQRTVFTSYVYTYIYLHMYVCYRAKTFCVQCVFSI